jgi:hypothetical protein
MMEEEKRKEMKPDLMIQKLPDDELTDNDMKLGGDGEIKLRKSKGNEARRRYTATNLETIKAEMKELGLCRKSKGHMTKCCNGGQCKSLWVKDCIELVCAIGKLRTELYPVEGGVQVCLYTMFSLMLKLT